VIVDPFMGSGMAITKTLELIKSEKVKKVWGIEPLPLPALVAYVAILTALDGRKELIEIVVGDAFEIVSRDLDTKSKADVILTNPPFTRWKYLEKDYRESLLRVISDWGYGKYITRKEISLQTLCLYLSDYILNQNGLIISVLPVSTFYTIYGKGYKWLLKSNYNTLGILEILQDLLSQKIVDFKEVI